MEDAQMTDKHHSSPMSAEGEKSSLAPMKKRSKGVILIEQQSVIFSITEAFL